MRLFIFVSLFEVQIIKSRICDDRDDKQASSFFSDKISDHVTAEEKMKKKFKNPQLGCDLLIG